MTFASVGNLTSGNSSTANQSSLTTASVSLTVGRLYVLILAMDNNQTTDGDEGAVTSVTDSGGVNTWTKAKEFCNGQGAAQAGATVSIWYTRASSALSSGTITANLSNNTSRDKTCWTLHEYTTGGAVAVEASNTLANDGADPGALDATTGNLHCLRIRGIAGETNSTTALTATDGTWTVMTGNQTSGGSAAANMAVRAEFKISTGTGASSNPTFTAVDCASAYVAFKETSQDLQPSLFSDGETFFTQTVTPGAVNLSPSLYSDGESFFTQSLLATIALSASLFEDGDTFFTPVVSATITLSPALYDDADTFYTHDLTTGGDAVNLSPSLFEDPDTFFDPTVSATYTISPELYQDGDTFFTADILPGGVSIAPELYADPETFPSPSLLASISVAPDLYTDGDTFHAAALSSVVTLSPSLYIDDDTFYTQISEGGDPIANGGEYQITFRRRRR